MANLNTYTLRRAYFIFTMFVTALCTFFMVINDDNQSEMGAGRGFLIRSISALCWVICAYWYIKDITIVPVSSKTNPYRQRTIHWYCCYILFALVAITVNYSGGLKEYVSSLIVHIVSLVGLLGTFGYARRFGEHTATYKMVAFAILCAVAAYGVVYSKFNVLGDRGHFGVAYYSLYLLPLMLACDKRWVRYTTIIVVGIVVISSVKRGGLIAFAMGLLVFFLVNRHMKNKGVTGLIVTLAVVVLFTFILYFAVINVGDTLLERLFNSDDDTGSGRTEIWAGIFNRLKEQGISRWIFGNGYLATMTGTSNGYWSGFSAHNDFLECLFDYGALTLLCYFAFLFSWAQYIVRAIRQRSRFAAPLAMMWVIYFILSMISIIFLYYTSLLSMITVGTLIGWNEYDQYKNLVTNNENRNLNIPSCA